MKTKFDCESREIESPRRRKPLIPPNQSWEGVAALPASVIVAVLAFLFVWICVSTPGFASGAAFGATIFIAVPVTIFALLLALGG